MKAGSSDIQAIAVTPAPAVAPAVAKHANVVSEGQADCAFA